MLPKEIRLNKYAILKLFVNNENMELFDIYDAHINRHNYNMLNTAYPNSGFDIMLPKSTPFDTALQTTMVNFEIKAEMTYYEKKQDLVENAAFYIFPRSSLSKTPLMLANHTGIIDSGYRGWIQGAFRWLTHANATSHDRSNDFYLDKYTRILQICHPSLCPILVQLVKEENELTSTERGSGGFGSTGIVGSIL